MSTGACKRPALLATSWLLQPKDMGPPLSDFLIFLQKLNFCFLLLVKYDFQPWQLVYHSIFSLTHSTSITYLIWLAPPIIWVCDLYLFTVAWLDKMIRQNLFKQGRFFRVLNHLLPGENERWVIHLSSLPCCSEDFPETIIVLWINICWGPATYQAVC